MAGLSCQKIDCKLLIYSLSFASWPFSFLRFTDGVYLCPMRWPLSARLPENFASSPSELLPAEDMR